MSDKIKIEVILDENHPYGDMSTLFASPGANAIDLRANIENTIILPPQQQAVLIPTGLRLNMSETPGLCALLLPRSGLGHKEGLVLGNGVGLIDNDYQGEIRVSAWNRNPESTRLGAGTQAGRSLRIEPGARIAQLLFIQNALSAADVDFEVVETFEHTERGEGGFGSTGT